MPDLPVTRAEFPHLDFAIDFLADKAEEPGFEDLGKCLQMVERYLRMELEAEIRAVEPLFFRLRDEK